MADAFRARMLEKALQSKPKYDPTKKVERYRPGKAPAWVQDEDDDDEGLVRKSAALSVTEPAKSKRQIYEGDIVSGPSVAEVQAAVTTEDDEDAEERRLRLKARALARKEELEIVDGAVASESFMQKLIEKEEEEAEDIETRRERMKQRALEKRREEEAALAVAAQQEAEEEEEESEYESTYETDDSEDISGPRLLLKPVFVPKSNRDTLADREKMELEAIALEDAERKVKEERKKQSKQLLIESLRRDEELEAAGGEKDAEQEEMPDDTDLNNEEEYESWKIRELRRVKRDRDEREARSAELADLERRKNMTEEEKQEEDKRLAALKPKEKAKYNFLQKYYHKGAFFQDKAITGDEPIYLRDYAEATNEDKVDKSKLPKAMQVRRGQFGRAGRTKYTHLLDQDTTYVNKEQVATQGTAFMAEALQPLQVDDKIRIKVQNQLAGYKGANELVRPSRKKK
eukprot:GILJ01004455.1.p1 GENE.GILJ01004455.1~~GILJ01004455.1.p1  ORF type:complete len:459 (-),score=123.25 GILJ01004455.1:42-1418(-)